MVKSKTYELALKIGGVVDGSLKKACTTADKNLSELGKSAKTAGKVGAAALAAIGTAVATAGTALYKVAESFDGAYDAIRIGTGATGEALADLQDSFKAVYSSVPAEMADVSTAISDYNTRLGVTGDTLEGLSAQALQVSDMLGDDLSGVIESSSQAFQQWNIAQEDMTGAMDYIFKVSQSTGVGFSDLMGDMQSYGAALQQYGYSFDEAATLLGSVAKSGYDVSSVFAGLKTGAANLADEGFSSLSEGMAVYVDKIKNAGTETEALSIAADVFGSKAATTMSAAIRDGTLSIEDMQAALEASGETISTAATDTYDFAERWALFKQRMAVAVEPAAMAIFDKIGEVFDEIAPKLEEMAPLIAQVAGNLVDKLVNEIIPAAINAAKWIKEHKTLILALAGGVASLVAVFKTLQTISTVVTTFKSLKEVFKATKVAGGTLKTAMSALNISTLGWAAAIVAAIAVGILIYKNWDNIKAWAISLGQTISQVWGNIKTWVTGTISDLVAAFQSNFPLLSAYITGWWQSISAAIENVKAIFTNIIDFIKNVFTGNWSGAWENIVNIFGNLFGLIVNLAKAPINGVISAINWVLSKINSISVTIPDWVPGVGGKTLGFNIPTIPALASGGVATAATLAMVGEGGEPEAILPLSKLAALLDEWSKPKPSGGGGTTGGGTETITFSPVFQFYGPTTKEEAEEAGRVSFAEFKRLYKQMKAEESRKSFAPA